MTQSVFHDKQNLFFLGIGGIGMSALARYFHQVGKRVEGYDKTPSPLTKQLEEEGIVIHYEDDPKLIDKVFSNPNESLVVYTPAIPKENQELQFFLEKGIKVLKRSAVLGEISKNYKTVAIAGTHGKTTTSSILTHLLQSAGKKILAFVGGINQNNSSNVVIDANAEIMITEADEFDKSFLTLSPSIALITSMDADHLDIYGTADSIKETYVEFSNQLKPDGTLIVSHSQKEEFKRNDLITYGVEHGSVRVESLKINEGKFEFNVVGQDWTIENCTLKYPGRHNLENALGAVTIAKSLGVDTNEIRDGLASYRGVKRRFEQHVNEDQCVYIDDYAHHPEEIKAVIKAVREFYPGKNISGIFQPHLYSRTQDFLAEFAKSLDLLDEVILLDIYPAREKPIPGVTSSAILEQMKSTKKRLLKKEDLLPYLTENKSEVLITMGAGDIDRLVHPIKELMLKTYA